MAQLQATNVRVNRQLDGVYVEITWDDPNTTATTEVRFYKPSAAGVTPITYNLAAKTAVLPAGDWQIKLLAGTGTDSLRTLFTVTPVAPEVPTPVVLTPLEHAQALWPDFTATDRVGKVIVEDELGFNPDGSVA